jgi:hypothetical protein
MGYVSRGMSFLAELLLGTLAEGLFPESMRARFILGGVAGLGLAAGVGSAVLTSPDPLTSPAWGFAAIVGTFVFAPVAGFFALLPVARGDADRPSATFCLAANALAMTAAVAAVV